MDIWIDSTRGLLLIFLTVIANFVAMTMNCQLQNKMKTSSLFRNVVVFALIYFSVVLTSNPDKNPLMLIGVSIPVYVFFIVLMKQNLSFLMIELFLILSIFVASQMKMYIENKDAQEKDEQTRRKHQKSVKMIQKGLSYVLIPVLFVLLCVGFSLYLAKQYKDKGKDFSFVKFIFGTNTCTSIKKE